MDLGDPMDEDDQHDDLHTGAASNPHPLPDDLPTSLNDRKIPLYRPDVASYDLDAWGEGETQLSFTPAPLKFNLNFSLTDPDDATDSALPAPSALAGHHDKYRAVDPLLAHSAIESSRPGSRLAGFDDDSRSDNQDSFQGVDDFYNPALTQDRLEEEMAESMRRHRMLMESAMNQEVDLGNVGLDEQSESQSQVYDDDEPRFIWDRCLGSQMFNFAPQNLGAILDCAITNFKPARNKAQKPVPANIVFLAARYAHYHASQTLLDQIFETAIAKIETVVDRNQQDLAFLAFWSSNCVLLLYYLRKDSGLQGSTSGIQATLAELISDITTLIERDGERRLDRVLVTAMLDFENNPRPDLKYSGEWSLFRSKPKAVPVESIDKQILPPTLEKQARVSPENIKREFDSIAFVLGVYDVHVVIKIQILAQLLYWINARVFNLILSTREYRSRHKATQIRYNIWLLEDYFRRQSQLATKHDLGIFANMRDTMVQTYTRQLGPVIQLLQWLQALSAQQDVESLQDLISKVPLLSAQQLIHTAKGYRAESTGEKMPPKKVLRQIESLRNLDIQRKSSTGPVTPNAPVESNAPAASSPATLVPKQEAVDSRPSADGPPTPIDATLDELPILTGLLLQEDYMLPFSLPTATDLLKAYGAGYGGVDRERERRFTPEVPDEFWEQLDGLGLTTSVSRDGNGNNDKAEENEAEDRVSWTAE